jgi:hypothetical protein
MMRETGRLPMAKKRTKKKPKWEEYIDPTQIRGATGRMRIGYKWEVKYGKHKLSGEASSHKDADREVSEAKFRIQQAIDTKDKSWLIKPPKKPFIT